jgi:hypothetical protein
MTGLGAIAAVFSITFVVPLMVYGAASRWTKVDHPTRLPLRQFMATVALEKAGVAVAFVGVMILAGEPLRNAWAAYAALWFVMFAVTEVTEVFRRNQGFAEAAAGVASELLYFPLASLVAAAILS